MTSTNDGKDVKSNQSSGPKGKSYYIELYRSIEAGLEAGDVTERTKHLCSAWRRVHSLFQHSAPPTQTHLFGWIQRHTARTVLQEKWRKPEHKDDRQSLSEAIDSFIAEAEAAKTSRDGSSPPWEVQLVARGEWYKTILERPWDHPVLKLLVNPNDTAPTDEEVLKWLTEERGVTFVMRLHTLVVERAPDIAMTLASAVMGRVRASMPAVVDVDESLDKPPAEEGEPTFGDKLKDEAGFLDVWDLLTDMEFVLLHKLDSKRCIALAKQTPLSGAYRLIERLPKRLAASPREKKLWKNAKEVAILIAQVMIARCMMIPTCLGSARTALYCCGRLLAQLLPAPRLPPAADALANQAPTARHLHTLAQAVDKELASMDVKMKPYICELYVRAITAGMNELERLKLKTEKEAEARLMENKLASWFVQLGDVLCQSDRILCECTLTAFSVHPSQRMYERVSAAPLPTPVAIDTDVSKEDTVKSEFGSWASDSRSQTNFVKTSETLNMKHTHNQANVLSTAIFNEGEALGLSPELCQDIAVLLSGPRVKTLSWDMDRSLLMENCRAYMIATHGGTRLLTRELKYLNIDPAQYQHLPEEQDDENDPYYGIERGYEHLVPEEPEDLWEDIEEKTETASSCMEDDFIVPRRKKKTKKPPISSEEDSDPLSFMADAKRDQKKKERPHSKERSKERAKKKPVETDPLSFDSPNPNPTVPKVKKERKKKATTPRAKPKKSLAALIGLKVAKIVKKPFKHVKTTTVITPVTDSDYDSQGKNSLNSINSEGTDHEILCLEDLKGQGRKKSIDSKRLMMNKTKNNSASVKPGGKLTYAQSFERHLNTVSRMPYRPLNPGAVRVPSPLNHTGNASPTFKPSQDEIRAGLSRLLDIRRQQTAMGINANSEYKNNVLQTPTRKPAILRPDMPIQANISPKAVSIPDIPKSYIQKQHADKLAELKRVDGLDGVIAQKRNEMPKNEHYAIPSPVIQYAKKTYGNPNTYGSSSDAHRSHAIAHNRTDPASVPYARLMAEITERQDLTRRHYDNLRPPQNQQQANYLTPQTNTPQQRSNSVMTSGQRDYHNFLKEYELLKNAAPSRAIDMTSKRPPIENKKEIQAVNKVTAALPSSSNKPESKTQCAKQSIQQKKPENSLNTFSRLSYMHKNKQMEIKNKLTDPLHDSKTYQDVSSELDQIIKEHQEAQRRVIQAKNERFDRLLQDLPNAPEKTPSTKTQKVNKNCEMIKSKTKEHSLLSNLLNAPSVDPSKCTQINKSVLTNKQKPVSPPKKTSLSEKDQNDLLYLLRQQNRLNSPNHSTINMNSTPSTSKSNNAMSNNISPTINYKPTSYETQQFQVDPATTHTNNQPCLYNPNAINIISNSLIKPGHGANAKNSVDSKAKSVKPLVKSEPNDPQDKIKKSEDKSGVKNTPVKYTRESDKPEWQAVLSDLLKHKTPIRGPNALDVTLKKSSFELAFEKSLLQSTVYAPVKPSEDYLEPVKQKYDSGTPKSVKPSVQNVVISSNKVKIQKQTKRSELKQSDRSINAQSQKLNQPEMAKKVPQDVQRKQFTYAGAKDVDPFISGIRNSDYDLLEELMDDDLRKEIGELSSDDESFNTAAQSFLKPNKGNEKRVSVEYNKFLNDAATKKSEVRCPNTRQPTNEGKQSIKPKHCYKTEHTAHENDPIKVTQNTANIQDNVRLISSTSQIVPAHVSINPALTNQVAVEPNIYISAVPQQTPLQNVVLIGSQLVYEGYSTVQTPVHAVSTMAPNAYVTVNNAPNMTLYQTPQFGTSVANSLIIGSAMTVPIINNVGTIPVISNTISNNEQPSYLSSSVEHQVSQVQDLEPREIVEHCETSSSDVPVCPIEKNKQVTDTFKMNERKVLSEVQELAPTESVEKTWSQKIEYEIMQKKDAAAEQERLKKKRQAIINREIYHRCGEKPIPLTYSPLPSKKELSKVVPFHLHQIKEKQESICEEDNILITKIQSDLQDLSDTINEVRSPATPDSTDSKENKSTRALQCRRILLRSSNKVVSKSGAEAVTPEPAINKKSKVKLKPDHTEASKKDTTITSHNTSKDDKETSVQKRASKRLRNKTLTINKEVEKTPMNKQDPNSKPKVSTKTKTSTKRDKTEKFAVDSTNIGIEVFDIEAELLGSKKKKQPTKNVTAKYSITRNGYINAEEKNLNSEESVLDPKEDFQINIDAVVTSAERLRNNTPNETKTTSDDVISAETTSKEMCYKEYDKPVIIDKADTNIVVKGDSWLKKDLINNEMSERKPPKHVSVVKSINDLATKENTSRAASAVGNNQPVVDSNNQPVFVRNSKDLGIKGVNLTNEYDVSNAVIVIEEVPITFSKEFDAEDMNENSPINNYDVTVASKVVKLDPTANIEEINTMTTIKHTLDKDDDSEVMLSITDHNVEGVLENENLDLDMTVTCEEVIPKMSLDFGKIKTARKKSDLKRIGVQVSDLSDIASKTTETANYVVEVNEVPVPPPSKEMKQDIQSNHEVTNQMQSEPTNITNSNQEKDDVVLIDDESCSEPKITKAHVMKAVNNTSTTKIYNGMSVGAINNLSDLPQSFIDGIKIQELPTTDPLKKNIRVTLPNGRKCLATVYGEVHVTFDSLFTYPSIKEALLGKFDTKKLILNQVTTVDSSNPNRVLSAHIQDSSLSNNQQSMKAPVETIDLLSDDEDNHSSAVINKEVQTFQTEFGKYKITPMDNDVFTKHQAIFSQKSLILLKKCDFKDVAVSNKKKAIQKNCLPAVNENLDKIVPNFTKTSTHIPEIVEIDDSSNDSLNNDNTLKKVRARDKINELRNILLEELRIGLPETTVNNVEKTKIKNDDTIIEIIDTEFECTDRDRIENNKTVINLSDSEMEYLKTHIREEPLMKTVSSKKSNKILESETECCKTQNFKEPLIKAVLSEEVCKTLESEIGCLNIKILENEHSNEKMKTTSNKERNEFLDSEIECVKNTILEEESLFEMTSSKKLNSSKCVMNNSSLFANIDKRKLLNIINRKCYVKLNRCDDLVQTIKPYENESHLAEIVLQDEPVIITDFSILDDLDTKVIDESEVRSSSPVIELSDVLATLDSQSDSIYSCTKTQKNLSLACDASWFSTKKMFHWTSVNALLLTNVAHQSNKNAVNESSCLLQGVSTPCAVSEIQTEAVLFRRNGAPSLKSLVLKRFQDTNIIHQYALESGLISQPCETSLKRKSSSDGTAAAKIIKLESKFYDGKIVDSNISPIAVVDSSVTKVSNVSTAGVLNDSKANNNLKVSLDNKSVYSMENLNNTNNVFTEYATGSEDITSNNHNKNVCNTNTADELDDEPKERVRKYSPINEECVRAQETENEYSETNNIDTDFARISCTPPQVLEIDHIHVLDDDMITIDQAPIPMIKKSNVVSSECDDDYQRSLKATDTRVLESNVMLIAPIQSLMKTTNMTSIEVQITKGILSEDSNNRSPLLATGEDSMIMLQETDEFYRTSALSSKMDVANILTTHINEACLSLTMNEETLPLDNVMNTSSTTLVEIANFINSNNDDDCVPSSIVNEEIQLQEDSSISSTPIRSHVEIANITSDCDNDCTLSQTVEEDIVPKENSEIGTLAPSPQIDIKNRTSDCVNDCLQSPKMEIQAEVNNSSMNSIPELLSHKKIENVTCDYVNNSALTPTLNIEVEPQVNNEINKNTPVSSSQIEMIGITTDCIKNSSLSPTVNKESQPKDHCASSDCNNGCSQFSIDNKEMKSLDINTMKSASVLSTHMNSDCDNDDTSILTVKKEIQTQVNSKMNSTIVSSLQTPSDCLKDCTAPPTENKEIECNEISAINSVPTPCPQTEANINHSDRSNNCLPSLILNKNIQLHKSSATNTDNMQPPNAEISEVYNNSLFSMTGEEEMQPQDTNVIMSDCTYPITEPSNIVTADDKEHEKRSSSLLTYEEKQLQNNNSICTDLKSCPIIVTSEIVNDSYRIMTVNEEIKLQKPKIKSDLMSTVCESGNHPSTLVDKEMKSQPIIESNTDPLSASIIETPTMITRECLNDTLPSMIVVEEMEAQLINETNSERVPSPALNIFLVERDTDKSTTMVEEMQPQLANETKCSESVLSPLIDILECEDKSKQSMTEYERMSAYKLTSEVNGDCIPSAITIISGYSYPSIIADEEIQTQLTSVANYDPRSPITAASNIKSECHKDDNNSLIPTDVPQLKPQEILDDVQSFIIKIPSIVSKHDIDSPLCPMLNMEMRKQEAGVSFSDCDIDCNTLVTEKKQIHQQDKDPNKNVDNVNKLCSISQLEKADDSLHKNDLKDMSNLHNCSPQSSGNDRNSKDDGDDIEFRLAAIVGESIVDDIAGNQCYNNVKTNVDFTKLSELPSNIIEGENSRSEKCSSRSISLLDNVKRNGSSDEDNDEIQEVVIVIADESFEEIEEEIVEMYSDEMNENVLTSGLETFTVNFDTLGKEYKNEISPKVIQNLTTSDEKASKYTDYNNFSQVDDIDQDSKKEDSPLEINDPEPTVVLYCDEVIEEDSTSNLDTFTVDFDKLRKKYINNEIEHKSIVGNNFSQVEQVNHDTKKEKEDSSVETNDSTDFNDRTPAPVLDEFSANNTQYIEGELKTRESYVLYKSPETLEHETTNDNIGIACTINHISNVNNVQECKPHSSLSHSQLSLKYNTNNSYERYDDIEAQLAEIVGETLMENVSVDKKVVKDFKCKASYSVEVEVISEHDTLFGDVENQLSGTSDDDHVEKPSSNANYIIGTDVEFIYRKNIHNLNDEADIENLEVMLPKRTYSTCNKHNKQRWKNLKRKMDMCDVKTHAKKYRKGKNIDHPKPTVAAQMETAYAKEYKRIFDYCSSVKFSYAIPFHKEHIDVHQTLKSWPINKNNTISTEDAMEASETLFTDIEKPKAISDPLDQTLSQELICEYNEHTYKTSNIDETNFTTGFGEGSGRVIQKLKDGEYTTFSAATLSDVKQLQPLLPSDKPQAHVKYTNCVKHELEDQRLKIKRFVDHLNVREKVRRYFEKTTAELNSNWIIDNKKEKLVDDDTNIWPFGFTSINFIRPPPVEITVNVVQVGQLPASAAAQNPVTCDPRVTHVSNVSPSQCSPENSSGDDIQTSIKTEYTELTTADITLPLMQQYAQHHHSTPGESQEPTNIFGAHDSMSVIKIELVEETSQENMHVNEDFENVSMQQVSNGSMDNGMQYHFHHITNMAEREPKAQTSTNSEKPKNNDSFDTKQHNVSLNKSDQIVHAMNAAGITAAQGMAKTNSADALVDTISRNAQSEVVTTPQANSNSYPKQTSINTISLQQALAQILPPTLNQTNSTENNQLTSANAQVLHLVQGNNSPSVINKPHGSQLLHIVQNKTSSSTSTTPTSQPSTFTGLSLVEGTIEQNGNQLLHIVNTANQKNTNAGQLLKRVNLLTNLANVQGSNEQKMVQFVCKSADGKSIQLPHQRSMVLRLQSLDPPNANIPTNAHKQSETQDNPSSSNTNSVPGKDPATQEMKSRSLYEENYAKFVQNEESKQSQEKSNCLPKFNQVFGKQVYQDKPSEVERENLSENSECPPQENTIPLDQITEINNTPVLTRKPPTQPSPVQPNLVQQIKQSIGPMNIQTMHGGVIYTRQIPVNLGGGQTINLITVPSTEMTDEGAQKQQTDGKFGNQESDPPIIKIVQTNQASKNSNAATDETTNGHLASTSESNAQPNLPPQPQPVLTQMRIKLPMLSKAPQMVGGTRLVRPSFFQIQRNVIGGANQQVYQQLVLTAAPHLGQSIRLPAQVQKPKTPSETQSSPESQMSSSTLEQLREFDMVLEQVKERSTVQPGSSTSTNLKKINSSADTTDAPTPSTSSQKSSTPVLYSVGNTQPLNIVNYVNRKSTITSTTTSSLVRSPDSTAVIESPSSSTQSRLSQSGTSDSCASSSCASSSCASEAAAASVQPKPKKKKPKPSTSNSNPFNIKNVPKPSSQKPLEDEQTTQKILYILAEYREQVENSPDKDKPAPRRRNNLATPNAGSSKRKKSGSRRRDMSPVLGEDSCRTMGSEDSSCGTSMGECNDCLESHSPENSPRKVVRKLTFEQETHIRQSRTVPQRNVIVADGQAFAVRGATGKPATTVLMPANYLLPVSMVKGGQQIAIVTNRGPKLLVGAGEGGTGGALLFQRLIGPGGLKPMLTRPGVRHIRLPTAALHNLQAFNIAAPATTVQPPDSTASPAPAPTPSDLVDSRAVSSPWPDRDAGEAKPDRGNSSPDGSEPWNLPSSSIADDYGYEEIVRTDNMDRTVLDAIPDRYSPDIEAQRIFDKMFDVDSKKSMYDSRCSYDIDASDDDKAYHQVVQRKDGRHTRLTHVSTAALRHKYAILEHELRLQKSLSEECEDLGVDTPSASELFPEAELLFAPSPAHEQTIEQCHSPPTLSQGIPQPDIDDQLANDRLLTHRVRHDELDINLDDVGEIVTVGEDGVTTIPLDHEEFARSHEEFARSHPNTTFHSEPEDGEIPPFTIAQGIKGRQITFHSRGVPGTVVMAPQTTVISQATVEAAGTHTVKFTDIDNMINAMPSPNTHNVNVPSVLVKDGNEGLSKFDRLLNESRAQQSNSSPIVHSTGNGTQVIRRVAYETRRDARYPPDSDTLMPDARETRDLDTSSPERHPELFWENRPTRPDRRFDFSSDSDKCCKSPYDETNSDSSGIGAHTRLDSVIKAARTERRSDGSSEDNHPPLRTYPAKRPHHHSDLDRSATGKSRAGQCHDGRDESRRRASNRGVVKRGCHCCNGSTPPKSKKSKKKSEYPH